MDTLSDVQLKKMVIDELDSLVESLYAKHDYLRSTITNEVWVGDYGGVSSSAGIDATREIEAVKAYIKRVESVIDEKSPSTNNDVHTRTNDRDQSEIEELYFPTYAEAKEWSMRNVGKAFTKSENGIGFVPVKK